MYFKTKRSESVLATANSHGIACVIDVVWGRSAGAAHRKPLIITTPRAPWPLPAAWATADFGDELDMIPER